MTPRPTIVTAMPPPGSPDQHATRDQPVGATVACVKLRKVFPDGTVALNDLDLHVDAGRIAVLLGPSGCGKTTLLRAMAGLTVPTSGGTTVAGRPVQAGHRASPNVAMVFQNYALYPNKTGFQNIEFPLRMARVPRAERAARVNEIARILHIEKLLSRHMHELSGGQRQRIGIGRALVRNPSLVLMDEPLSNLDADLRVQMRSEIKTLQRLLGMTLVFVTHDQSDALALADDLVVMKDGQIEQLGSPDEVYDRPASTFVAGFLGGMNIVGIGSLPATATSGISRLDPSRVTQVGIRAEDFKPGPGTPQDLTFEGTVLLTELLGRERLIHLEVGDTKLRVRVRADVPVHDGRFTGHISLNDVHAFDSAGQRTTLNTT
ncbi:ABC transporter ATP-binding protein [Phytohabitans sp. ZYX-F-186]|uniref:ABC transporter ATP-binding protein n=1 Tax=Phytohabitans maris TaxID=3071409 RepID=A0ABU0ZS27_9ACTN|nr:ABC transporter ATP-binding protein [Phytohabitans sp. ZYX-F-186]MDQ7908752.1 ABC transporter ATP-binding protein [Phytohabitans sp. ZYX-F-186]